MKYPKETIFDIEDLCFIKKILIKSKEEQIKSSPFFRDGFTMEDYLIKKINKFLEERNGDERMRNE